MRLEKTTIHAFGSLSHVDLDLASIDARIIAIVGDNGAGKTMLSELSIPGAMLRATATRGSLASLATARDSYVESTIVHGSRYRIRHTVDAISGKSDSLVLREDGTPVLADAKVRSFDAWARQHMPTPDVLYASVFAPQGSGGFLDLRPAERKAVLLRVLGIERIEHVAEKVREHARAAKAAYDVATARAADEKDRIGDVDALRVACETASHAYAKAMTDVRDATDQCDHNERLARAAEVTVQARRDYDQRLAVLSQRKRRTTQALIDRKTHKQTLLDTVAAKPAIDDAITHLNVLRSELEAANVDRVQTAAKVEAEHAVLEHLEAERIRAHDAAVAIRQMIAEKKTSLGDYDARIYNNRALLERGDAIRAAAEKRVELEAQLSTDTADLRAIDGGIQHTTDQIRQLDLRLQDANARSQHAADRIATAEQRLADRDAVMLAVDNLPRLAADVDRVQAELDACSAELDDLSRATASDATARASKLRDGLTRVVKVCDDHQGAAKARTVAQEALDDDTTAIALAEALPARIEQAKTKLAAATADHGRTIDEHRKAQTLAARLSSIEAAEADVLDASRARDAARIECDRIVADLAQYRDALDNLTTRRDALVARIAAGKDAVQGITSDSALLDRLLQAAARIDELTPQRDAIKAELDAYDDKLVATANELHDADRAVAAQRDSITATKTRLASAVARVMNLQTKIDALVCVASRATDIARAEAALVEVDAQIDAAGRDLAEAIAAIDALGAPPEVLPMPNIDAARASLDAARAAEREALAAHTRAQHALETAEQGRQRLDELQTASQRAAEDLADWTRLADDLGRNGLQAMEIDAAGPELTALINDLLHTCVGPRWTVVIDTQRQSADGKRTLDGLEVRVIDTERGRDADATTLSGGERVIVSEAIALALSMLACRRSGVHAPTIVRDETGAALDAANGHAYVAMLRRAADIVGASQVLFVSHSQDVQDLADAKIVVREGTVAVHT